MMHGRTLVSIVTLSLIALAGCATASPAPPHPDVHIRKGIQWLKRGNCRAALQQFERALAFDPHNFRAHVGAGASAWMCNRPALARRHWNAALRWAPDPRWERRIRRLLRRIDRPHHAHHAPSHHPRGVDVDVIIVWLER